MAPLLAVLSTAALTAWWIAAGGFDVPWAPTVGLRLHVELDGLALLYGLLATGVGAAVFTYASAYVPLH